MRRAMINRLKRAGPRGRASALGVALVLGSCGGAPELAAVERCLRDEGLSVARQPAASRSVKAWISFTASSPFDPRLTGPAGSSGSVILYASEDEAARSLQPESERLGEKLRQEGKVLYSPVRMGRPDFIEGCIVKQ